MRHNDDDFTDKPLKERIQLLFNNYSQHSDEKLAFPSKKDTRIADSLAEVEEYAKEIMKIPSAEGVVIKDIESTYFVGTKKNPKWIKWKKFVDLDLIALDFKATKSKMFNYLLGAGPLTPEESKNIKSVKYGENSYIPLGRSVNTKIEVEKGTIVRVKVDEVKQSPKGFRIFNAQVIELPEVTAPDKLVTIKLLAADTKESLSYKTEALTKGVLLTDYIHGETIVKANLDGFITFDRYNLMSKNAIIDIDLWKEQIEEIYKEKKGFLRTSIVNFLKDRGESSITQIDKYLLNNKQTAPLYEEVFRSNKKGLKNYMINQTGSTDTSESFFIHIEKDKFKVEEDIIAKYETPEETRDAKFKLYQREDGDLQFLIQTDKLLAWTIKINTVDDIFNLFGKSKRFPARVESKMSRDKLIDQGKLELGVQRHGYHEYMLSGNKFNTKLHFRVLPIKDENYWLAFTGTETKPVNEASDDGVWDITHDKYNNLSFEGLE